MVIRIEKFDFNIQSKAYLQIMAMKTIHATHEQTNLILRGGKRKKHMKNKHKNITNSPPGIVLYGSRKYKKNSDEVIIYLSKYSLEIENIISINEDSIKVELIDDWWWNKPKQPVFNNRSPIESMTDQSEASYSEVIAIEDITAIQLIKEKPLILLLLPGILVLVLMKSFGL